MHGLLDRAEGRSQRAVDRARDLLAEASPHQAMNAALRQMQGELAKVRRRRPADAALIDAHMAGMLLGLSSQLADHRPARPPGCPRVPGPSQLLHAFASGWDQSWGEEGPS